MRICNDIFKKMIYNVFKKCKILLLTSELPEILLKFKNQNFFLKLFIIRITWLTVFFALGLYVNFYFKYISGKNKYYLLVGFIEYVL